MSAHRRLNTRELVHVVCGMTCNKGYRPYLFTREVNCSIFAWSGVPERFKGEGVCMTDAQRDDVEAIAPGSLLLEDCCR